MHGVWPANLIKRQSMFYCLAECDRPWLTDMFPGSPEHRACCLLFCKLAQLRAGITRNRGTAPPPLKERFGDCDLYCRNLFAIIIQAEMRCWGGYPDEMPPILKWWINIVTENKNMCDWIGCSWTLQVWMTTGYRLDIPRMQGGYRIGLSTGYPCYICMLSRLNPQVIYTISV